MPKNELETPLSAFRAAIAAEAARVPTAEDRMQFFRAIGVQPAPGFFGESEHSAAVENMLGARAVLANTSGRDVDF